MADENIVERTLKVVHLMGRQVLLYRFKTSGVATADVPNVTVNSPGCGVTIGTENRVAHTALSIASFYSTPPLLVVSLAANEGVMILIPNNTGGNISNYIENS